MGAQDMRKVVLLLAALAVVVLLVSRWEAPETFKVEDVKELLYHLPHNTRSCAMLRTITAPIALGGSCHVSESEISNALPVVMTPEARFFAAPHVIAACKQFPDVPAFLEAVNKCTFQK
jgi:hypothetical protein